MSITSAVFRINRFLLLIAAIAILNACGGGGGGGSDPSPLPPTPTPPAPPPAPPAPAPVPDADNDGVPDNQDNCANSPANVSVDANGCAAAQLDSDLDSVNDAIDQCPATPQNEAVDSIGCGVVTQGGGNAGDLDGDMVTNQMDICPETPNGELVDTAGCSDSQKDSDNDGVSNDLDSCDMTPAGEPINARGCGTATETGVIASAFVEQNGMLVVELESTNYSGDWHVETGKGAKGNAYLLFNGSDNFNQPDVDTITIPVVINNPGIYRFQWRNIIGEGDSPTEANDSWLKIASNNFFGEKISDAQGETPVGHIVCPNGRDASNRCEGERPEGSTRDGWFKAYRNGGPVDAWVWRVFTSDFDPHAIFAEFDNAGEYNILVSGRSFGHGIDRLVMYRSGNADNNIEESEATSLTVPESQRRTNDNGS